VDGESRRNFEVDRIPTGLVERVEIIRAPRASVDGAGAAGSVNIVLKDGADLPPGTEVTVGGGYLEDNGGLGELTVSHTGRSGPLSFTLAGSVQQFRRNESKDFRNFNGAGAPTDGENQLNERRFEQVVLTPSFTLDMGSSGKLTLNPFYFFTKELRDDIRETLAADQITITESRNEEREREREAYGSRAAWEVELGAHASLRVGIDWQEGRTDTERDETRFNAAGAVTRRTQRTEDIDLQKIRPEAVLSVQAGAHDMSFGIGANLQEHNETNTEVRNGAPRPPREDRIFDIDEDIYFGFVEDVWQPSDRLTVTGGLRAESSTTKTTDFFGASTSNDETFVLPSLNVVYNLSASNDLRFGLARTLRRPDLRTLSPSIEGRAGTAADPDRQGNPNQAPESIWGLDVGFDHYFAENRGFLSFNLFARQFDDKIENVTAFDAGTGRFVSTPQNVGDGEAYGIELSGRAPLDILGLAGASVWGSGVLIETSVDDPFGGSRRFLDQPDFVGTIGLDYEYRPWKTTFGLALNWTSSVDQSQSLAGGGSLSQSIDSRARLDLSTRTEIADNTFLSLSVTNLLAQTEDRVDRIFDGAGVLQSSTRTSEQTYRTYFVRLTRTF
jgi:iron complex outermembrane receptor protein